MKCAGNFSHWVWTRLTLRMTLANSLLSVNCFSRISIIGANILNNTVQEQLMDKAPRKPNLNGLKQH